MRERTMEALERGELTNGKTIRQLRKSSGMTQHEFSKAFGFTEQALGKLENDKSNPTLKTLNKVGKKFGLRIVFQKN